MKKTFRFIYHLGELVMVVVSALYLVELIVNLVQPMMDFSFLKPVLIAGYAVALLMMLLGFVMTYDEFKARRAAKKAEKTVKAKKAF